MTALTARTRFLVTALMLATGLSTQGGCFWITAQGPNLGPLAFPIPVPVGVQKQKEDQFWNYERYERAPVLGPIPPGGPRSSRRTWTAPCATSSSAASAPAIR
jgi:hypothetical protein